MAMHDAIDRRYAVIAHGCDACLLQRPSEPARQEAVP
jgi:hypothetical protein